MGLVDFDHRFSQSGGFAPTPTPGEIISHGPHKYFNILKKVGSGFRESEKG